MTIRVLVADDQALVRSGFRMILEARDDLEVVGEAEDGARAVELVEQLDPDVVLMDIRMPNVDGVEATRRLAERGARARVLVLTTFDLDEYVGETTVKSHVSSILRKLGVRDRVQAVVLAYDAGLVRPAAG